MLGVATLAALGWAVSLLVSARAHTNDYAPFAQCPLGDPATDLCLFTQASGGELTIGPMRLGLTGTLALRGGIHVVQNGEREIVRDEFIPAAGAETVSTTSLSVPGGLHAVVDPAVLSAAQRGVFDRGSAPVALAIELAAPARTIGIDVQNLIEGAGTALTLPVRLRLSGALLGGRCFIGSPRHPVLLALTTGPTDPPAPGRPIRGRVCKASITDEYNLTTVRGTSLVSDSFTVPGARGCGSTRAVDRAVDAEMGLPAVAGASTVVLSGTLREANAPAVRASR